MFLETISFTDHCNYNMVSPLMVYQVNLEVNYSRFFETDLIYYYVTQKCYNLEVFTYIYTVNFTYFH